MKNKAAFPAQDESRASADVDTDKRRQLLKGVGLGGAALAVTQWTRPVVESVVLPAHAQTTTGALAASSAPLIRFRVGVS